MCVLALLCQPEVAVELISNIEVGEGCKWASTSLDAFEMKARKRTSVWTKTLGIW